ESVLEEVEMFFRVRRKILAPGILRDVLIRIGLPTAKKIVSAQDLEAAPPEVKKKTPTPKPEPKTHMPSEEEAPKVMSEKPPTEEAATFIENPELDVPGVTVLDGEDFTDIADALNAVESMSDSFMAARPKMEGEVFAEQKEEEPAKSGIRINVAGSEEIAAAPTTFASTPTTPEEHKELRAEETEPPGQETEMEQGDIVEEEPESLAELEASIPQSEHEPVTKPQAFDSEEIEPEAQILDTEDEIVPEPQTVIEDEEEPEIEEVPEPPMMDEIEEAAADEVSPSPDLGSVPDESPVKTTTPAHVVKPLIQSKILILGEAGVGKKSLMRKAELEPVEEEAPIGEPYIHTKLVETENHRVRVHVWSFDEAVKSQISRKDFYDEAEALIVVYAASDRWSFESIDFWLKEATITTDEVPPIVVVANKTDLVSDFEEDSGEEPVTSEEGFALAEELAKRFGTDEKLHPVAFIGTSCLTGEGVNDVFVTSAELAARNRPEE
ncbi:MAG: Rab family GTPase, partial [Candidatus Hermodarchaeota archaeon]